MRKYRSIAHALNSTTRQSIRWCTPSINFNVTHVLDHYRSDMSVSFEGLGFPAEPSGIFLDAYNKAAAVYKSDKTLFSVNGSTGSNFIVLRSLSRQIPNLQVLAQRNIHKSILNACQDYRINLNFIEPNVDQHLQFFLPNSIYEIVKAVKKNKPHVLLITNPTYEGFSIDLKKLIPEIRKISKKTIIFVEEAWGAHLIFSSKLPNAAMESGADICVQSTHKQGGAFQQAGMVHWNEERIQTQHVMESYRCLTSTSPSYILLSSLEQASSYMKKKGKEKINRSIEIAEAIEKRIGSLEGFKVVDLKLLRTLIDSSLMRDKTKVVFDISESGFTGYEIAKSLERKNIIIEKYNATTILFLVPFQAKLEHVRLTYDALFDMLKKKSKKRSESIAIVEPIPQDSRQIMNYHEVASLRTAQTRRILLKNSVGKIAAENIIPYPPGIPITIQGELITEEMVRYYQSLKFYPNMHIVANDVGLETVVVVK